MKKIAFSAAVPAVCIGCGQRGPTDIEVIYLANGEDLADPRFAGIGVRIEDNIAIEADGHENLTAAIPKQPGDLETLVGSGARGAAH